MSEVLINLSLNILMLILGAFISNFISRRYFKEDSKQTLFYGNKIEFKPIQIQVKIKNEKYHIEPSRDNKVPSKNYSSSDSYDPLTIIGVFLFISLIVIFAYLKLTSEIHLTLRLLSLFALSLLLTSLYTLKKNNIGLDNTFYSIIITTIISLILVQFSIYFSNNPLYFTTVNKADILKSMENNGYISLLSNYGIDIWGYLLYQLSGLIVSLILLILQITGVLYILSLLKYVFSDNINFIWRFIYKFTKKLVSKPIQYVVTSMILAVISLLLTSGFLANVMVTSTATYNSTNLFVLLFS